MGFCSQYLALLKKNFILWYRYLCGSLCEILFPLIIMLMIAISRFTISDETVAEKSYLSTVDAIYINENLALQSDGTSGSINVMGLSPARAFQSCLQYNRYKIGFAGVATSSLYLGIKDRLFGVSGFFRNLNGLSMEFSLQHFNSEAEMDDYVKDKDYETSSRPGLCAGIVIPSSGYSFSLRYDDNNYVTVGQDQKQQVPSTRDEVVDKLERTPDLESFQMYDRSGFLMLEYIIAKEVLIQEGKNTQITAGLVPMKTSEYLNDMFLSGASSQMPFAILLCYLGPIFRIISFIVGEKESKTREGMKMMGLKDSAYWLSFFTYYFVITLVISISMTSVSMGVYFDYSNWFIMFLFYLLYGLSIFAFAMFISAFFRRSRVASITGTMIYFASYWICSAVNPSTVSESSKNAASLLPTLALDLGCRTFLRYEANQYGINFSNASDLVDNYRFSMCLVWMAVDFVIYLLLALYVDNVMPSESGVHQPLYFFLTKEYWTGEHTTTTSRYANEEEEKVLYPNGNFEKFQGSEISKQGALKIRHLDKHFGSKHAVQNISMDMYSGQIFALLGPNGAGKTTTLSMLTGLIPADTGEAKFNDISVFKEMARVREMLGVCPQHDVLFERLTPREHLNIFAAFKGRSSGEETETSVQNILNDVDLIDCENNLACNLSGGQKRKLSIAISFIGDSPIIFLDEPTSGMDMRARHKVWDILKKYKKDKVIILTTHYMEEAEVLGDRIGIMTHGSMKCCGPPLFLKKKFNIGYNVTIVKGENAQSEQIKEFVKSYFPKATIPRDASKEISFHIPKAESKENDNFTSFLTDLDAKLSELQIDSYGMASSTLEDIFLQVAQGAGCLLYTSPSPRDLSTSRMPSSA
eukprot:TRINITY_DN29056_c0_g1_i1.p2 TRINITY_DN29056_c0_g1~~TRINITY_DN29056_c0_g1_i1.p2  ORF type:complete len:867 (-),score=99.53 TRINITY_DN29056_c0_g1_i1:129-2729(-)